jgi:hypothetical protein
MKSFVFSTLVLASMTAVALAGSPGGSKTTKVAPPVQLTNAEMDQARAGAVAVGASSRAQTRAALASGANVGTSILLQLPALQIAICVNPCAVVGVR